jgi:hypothetical protein
LGFFCPQNSISEAVLWESVGPVAEELKFHGVFGYITVDFVLLVPVSGPGQGSSIVRFFFLEKAVAGFLELNFGLEFADPQGDLKN